MGGDVSKKTLVILLIVAIVVSVVGTWVVLDNMRDVNISSSDVTEATGVVNVYVQENLPPDSATGQVVLNVKG